MKERGKNQTILLPVPDSMKWCFKHQIDANLLPYHLQIQADLMHLSLVAASRLPKLTRKSTKATDDIPSTKEQSVLSARLY